MLDLNKMLQETVQQKIDEYAMEILRIFKRIVEESSPKLPGSLCLNYDKEIKWGTFNNGNFLHIAQISDWYDFKKMSSHEFDTSARGVMFLMSFLHIRFQGEVYDIFVRVDQNGCRITDNHEYYGKLGDLKIDVSQDVVDQLLSEAEKLLEFHLDRVES